MKKLVLLKSVTGRAREYADRHFKYFDWFDDIEDALRSLSDGNRPWLVVVDGRGNNLGAGSRAASLGYIVQIKGVP